MARINYFVRIFISHKHLILGLAHDPVLGVLCWGICCVGKSQGFITSEYDLIVIVIVIVIAPTSVSLPP